MARLGEIVTIEASAKQISGNKFWLLNLDMVEQQTGNIIDFNYVGRDALNGSIIQFDTDCVLYSKLRPNLNKVVLPEQDGFATSEMLPLRPDTNVLTREYLSAFLRSESFVTWAVSKTAGAKMPRLGTKELLSKEIPLPSLTEQEKIAKRFSKISELIALRKEQLEKLDQLLKARFVEMFGCPKANNRNWKQEKLLSQMEVRGRVGWKGYTREDLRESGPLVLGATHLSNDGKIDLSDPVFLSEEKYLESPEIMVHRNDLIFAQRGSLGKIGLVEHEYEAATINPCVLILRPILIQPQFVRYLLMIQKDNGELDKLNSGSTIPMITQKSIGEFRIIVPPVTLQEKFAHYVEQTDKTKLTIQSSLDKLEIMKKALMQEYFG